MTTRQPPQTNSSESLTFKVIGPALGLGVARQTSLGQPQAASSSQGEPEQQPRQQPKQQSKQQPPRTSSQPLAGASHQPLSHQALSQGAASIGRLQIQRGARPRPSLSDRLMRWCYAWLMDLAIVLLSLWVVFTGALLTAGVKSPQGLKGGIDHWLTLRPVVLVASLNPWMLVAGVAGILFAYGLTFRFIVGRTLGKSWVLREQSQAQQGIAAPEIRGHKM